MNFKKMKMNIFAIFFLVLVLFVVTSLSMYNNALGKDLQTSTHDTLTEMLEHQKYSLCSQLTDSSNYLESIGKTLPFLPDNHAKLVDFLEEIRINTRFDHMLIVDKERQGLTSADETIDLSDSAHLDAVYDGQSLIWPTSMPHSNDQTGMAIAISVPLFNNNVVVGSLIGVYNALTLYEFVLPLYDGEGFVYITKQDGTIIIQPGKDTPKALVANKYKDANLFHALKRVEFNKFDNYEEIMAKTPKNGSGCSDFTIDGASRLLHYAPLGFEDWYIYVVVPTEVITSRAEEITMRSAMMTIAIICLLSLIVLFILYLQNKSRKEKMSYTSELERMAFYDEITNLPNIHGFRKLAGDVLVANPNVRFVVTKFDILNFKAVNELFGFEMGNQILQSVAEHCELLKKESNSYHLIYARVNADEFIVLDEVDGSPEQMKERVLRFEELFHDNMPKQMCDYRMGFCYGRYFLDAEEIDINSAIEKANLAHRLCKQKNIGKFCDFDERLKQQYFREIEIENKMENALKDNAFKVFLQPKYCLKDEHIVGAEALVRWREEDGSLIPPLDFIPLFERNGFILKLDMYMFEKVCQILRGWIDENKPVVPISVNFSGLHIVNRNFIPELEAISNKYAVPHKLIEIELTESIFFEHEQKIETLLQSLHNTGFRLSMDDFGTGYSSLGLLKNLPVDIIKIDRSFFSNSKYKSRAKSVVQSVVQMAKKLSIATVAEGVESKEHIDFLLDVGCDIVQGFYYAKPIEAERFFDCKYEVLRVDLPQLEFNINQIGDAKTGRSDFSQDMPVDIYRLFQYTIRDVLEDKYGEGEMIDVFTLSGKLAGKSFAKTYLDTTLPFNEFIINLQTWFEALRIGILNIERVDEEKNIIIITIDADLDCSGSPAIGKTLCHYDEGLIAGIFLEYTKREYSVKEISCWGTGDTTCRFKVKVK